MVTSSQALIDSHLHALRQQFPALVNKRYFNYGGQGPLPQAALDAMGQAQLTLQAKGPFSKAVKEWIQQETHLTYQTLADALQVPPSSLTLTENVTVGCNIPLWGLEWQPGDRILMTDCEHPGVMAAVQEMSRRFQVAVDVCPLLATAQGGDPVAVVAAALRPRTRLLVISHILWNTGQLLPLADIVQMCHHHRPHPVWVLVDAAQSVGMMPLDLTAIGVDFYAFTGHKWCCGPAGLGGLYTRPEVLEAIAPTFIGWRSITVDGQATPTGWAAGGKRYEVATSNYALMPGFRATMALHHEWGSPTEQHHRICQLSYQLWQRLHQHPRIQMVAATPPASGLVSFQLLRDGQPAPELHTRLVNTLESEHIFLRILLRPHCVRACVHYLTLASEVAELGDRIDQWLEQLP